MKKYEKDFEELYEDIEQFGRSLESLPKETITTESNHYLLYVVDHIERIYKLCERVLFIIPKRLEKKFSNEINLIHNLQKNLETALVTRVLWANVREETTAISTKEDLCIVHKYLLNTFKDIMEVYKNGKKWKD